jgi:hypothetical protein
VAGRPIAEVHPPRVIKKNVEVGARLAGRLDSLLRQVHGAVAVGEGASLLPQLAAGRTTSASAAVSVRKRSCTIRNSRCWDRIEPIRRSSGRDTAGLVPLTHRNRMVPCSTYRFNV